MTGRDFLFMTMKSTVTTRHQSNYEVVFFKAYVVFALSRAVTSFNRTLPVAFTGTELLGHIYTAPRKSCHRASSPSSSTASTSSWSHRCWLAGLAHAPVGHGSFAPGAPQTVKIDRFFQNSVLWPFPSPLRQTFEIKRNSVHNSQHVLKSDDFSSTS